MKNDKTETREKGGKSPRTADHNASNDNAAKDTRSSSKKKKLVRAGIAGALVILLVFATVVSLVTYQIMQRNAAKEAAVRTRSAYNELNTTVGTYSEKARDKRRLAISDASGNIKSINELLDILEEMQNRNEALKRTFEGLESEELQSFTRSVKAVAQSIEQYIAYETDLLSLEKQDHALHLITQQEQNDDASSPEKVAQNYQDYAEEVVVVEQALTSIQVEHPDLVSYKEILENITKEYSAYYTQATELISTTTFQELSKLVVRFDENLAKLEEKRDETIISIEDTEKDIVSEVNTYIADAAKSYDELPPFYKTQ